MHLNAPAPANALTQSVSYVSRFELAYFRLGFALFPVKAGDKAPMTANGFKDATRDLNQYRQLHRGKPHNIGLPTGEINGLWVLDVDVKHGGERSLERLIAQYGPLPDTWVARTQSGGLHYFFKWDEQRPVRNKVGVLPGIDSRGSGGYVLLAPSKVEGVYSWINPPVHTPLASAPDWLYGIIADKPAVTRKDLSHLAQGAFDGRRNVSMTELCGTLLGRGVDIELAWALVVAYNQVYTKPPLEEDELLRVFTSIASREIRKRRRRLEVLRA